MAKETRIMSNRPVYLIPNGVDILSSDGADTPVVLEKGGRTSVIIVSRMTKKKGVDSIVEIAPSLIKEHSDVLFLMVGDGPLKDKLEKRVKKQNMEQNFIFTGEVPRKRYFIFSVDRIYPSCLQRTKLSASLSLKPLQRWCRS